METDDGGGGEAPNPASRKRMLGREGFEDSSVLSGGGGEESAFLPYYKPNYTRLYPENSLNTEFKVFAQSNGTDRLGNKSPIYLNHIFSNDVKGVVAIHRVNANKIAVVFKQFNTANNFLTNTAFLNKYNLKAFIPAAQIEKTGIIRYVPTNISNKELYTKLSSHFEIVSVKRFMKKVNNKKTPLQTVSITFLSNTLPDTVQYDLFSYRVFDYVPPLQQCYRCMKFNHSAKICNGRQRCSCCGGDHIYKECPRPNDLCCANCSGPHLAISRECPIKMKKIEEKKNKITYASIANTKSDTNFPPLPAKMVRQNVNKPLVNNVIKPPVLNVNKQNIVQNTSKQLFPAAPRVNDIKSQLLNNNDLTMAIVRTLVELANKPGEGPPITTTTIKELLFKNIP